MLLGKIRELSEVRCWRISGNNGLERVEITNVIGYALQGRYWAQSSVLLVSTARLRKLKDLWAPLLPYNAFDWGLKKICRNNEEHGERKATLSISSRTNQPCSSMVQQCLHSYSVVKWPVFFPWKTQTHIPSSKRTFISIITVYQTYLSLQKQPHIELSLLKLLVYTALIKLSSFGGTQLKVITFSTKEHLSLRSPSLWRPRRGE